MEEWSIGVVVLALGALAIVLRLPWRRARVLRVESRIGRAAVVFDPLPTSPRAASESRAFPTATSTTTARTAALPARRAPLRRKPKRRTR